jgi:hypothetical protein
MPIKRKPITLLNRVRLDVEHVLSEIAEAGSAIEAAAFDLSKIHPHDVKTESADVKIRFDHLMDEYSELGKRLDQFRIAINKYREFF